MTNRYYFIQPEKRHYDMFPYLIRRLKINISQVEYLLSKYSNLPFAKSDSDTIVFCSYGFTLFALRNLIPIFSYKSVICVVHVGARFKLDLSRFRFTGFMSCIYFLRALFDHIFFLALASSANIQVCCLDQYVSSYLQQDGILPIFKKPSYPILPLVSSSIITFSDLHTQLSFPNDSVFNFLVIGAFDSYRIDFKSCGSYSQDVKLFLDSLNVPISFKGYVSDDVLQNYLNGASFLLCPYIGSHIDYSFIESFFETKATGAVLREIPIVVPDNLIPSSR